MAKVFEEEQLVVTWERIVFDDANFVMRTVFDTQKTVTTFHYGDGIDKALGEIVNLGESRRIAKSQNIPLTEYHNLGVVPALFLPNLPRKNFVGNVIGEWYPDDTPTMDKLRKEQEHLDLIFNCIEWELTYNRTSIYTGMSPQDQEEIRRNPSKLKEKMGKVNVYNLGLGNNFLPYNLDGSFKIPMEIIQGKPQLDILADYLNYSVDRSYNMCGYNSPWGNREHGTNKTASEVSINMQNDYLTTSLKKNLREHSLNRLISKIGKYLGIEEIDCKIEIHGMSTMEYSTLNEVIAKRFELGLISRKEAIMKLDTISEEEAEKMIQDIEEEQKMKIEENQNKEKGGSGNDIKG